MTSISGHLSQFPLYTEFDPLVPVYCCTPGEGRIIHRFFDTSPLSPGGRFLGLTRFPFEDRSPKPGDTADVVVVDLWNGQEFTVHTTSAWGSQLGAQVQWGRCDDYLFCNDMTADWKPFGVRYGLESQEVRFLDGAIYSVNSEGTLAVSPCLLRTGRTQLGYGVMAPDSAVPVNHGVSSDDGVYLTDLETGESRVLVSIQAIVGGIPGLNDSRYRNGTFYVFHTKWSPDSSRIMVILRWTPQEKPRRWWQKSKPASKATMRKFVLTVAADGSDPRMAISDEQWARGGHHPNWCPDSRHVMMNLNLDGGGIKFAMADLNGAEIRLLHPSAGGSGHPSLHPGGRYLLTDAYPGEPYGYGDGTVPIRLVDLKTGEEQVLVRIQSRPAYVGGRKEMRVDAHPAWDRSGNYVIFNGCPDGTRRVYIADVSSIIQPD